MEILREIDEKIWVANANGGLAQLSKEGNIEKRWTTWEGLPHNTVISVDAENKKLIVGTADGAALIENDSVTQMWNEELTHRYVQTVKINGEDIWLGAYHGL